MKQSIIAKLTVTITILMVGTLANAAKTEPCFSKNLPMGTYDIKSVKTVTNPKEAGIAQLPFAKVIGLDVNDNIRVAYSQQPNLYAKIWLASPAHDYISVVGIRNEPFLKSTLKASESRQVNAYLLELDETRQCLRIQFNLNSGRLVRASLLRK